MLRRWELNGIHFKSYFNTLFKIFLYNIFITNKCFIYLGEKKKYSGLFVTFVYFMVGLG